MNDLAQFGAWVSAHVAVTAAVVGVAAFLLRNRPTARHAVGLAGLGAIVFAPLAVLWFPPVAWTFHTRPTASPLNPVSTVPFVPVRVRERIVPTVPTSRSVATPAPVSTNIVRTTPVPTVSPLVASPWKSPRIDFAALQTWLMAGWLAGGALYALRWFLGWRKLTRHVAEFEAWEIDSALEEEVCRAAGLAHLPPLFASRSIPVPVVVGHVRPVVALPVPLTRSGDREAIRDVLIHECAHVARRDPWVHLAQRVAAIVYWPHPGVMLVNAILTRAREEICDNHVLLASPPTGFARTLLEMSERLVGVPPLAAQMGLMGTRWSLESRVRGLLDPRRRLMTRTPRAGFATAVLMFVMLGMLLGGVRRSDAQAPATADTKGDKSPLRKEFNVVGRVLLAGKPVEGVEVRAFAFADGKWSVAARAKTDAEGKYRLGSVPMPRLATGATGAMPLMVATREGTVAAVAYVNSAKLEMPGATEPLTVELVLGENHGSLTGTVVDGKGQPVAGAEVFLPNSSGTPIPGLFEGKTDARGRFEIPGLRCFTLKDLESFDPKAGTGIAVTRCAVLAKHPDFALSTGWHTAIPQEIRIVMQRAALVSGVVSDDVTGRPAAGALVQAQGIARHGWQEVRADGEGRFKLSLAPDHYNVWAVVEDRMPIALKLVVADPDKPVIDARIKMVRGGYVTGRVLDASGKPITVDPAAKLRVAHYGPARPRTGAAVTSVALEANATYRLHVAPGKNYVYLMSGTAAGWVTVEDGKETTLDLVVGKHPEEEDDPELDLVAQLRREALLEQEEANGSGKPAARPAPPLKQKRADTPTGRLLDRLESQNTRQDRFTDKWLHTLKELVDLGPDAVPELIAELDSTSNDMMLRCLGFTLRAIGDKRAIPALIRAIPKTLLPPGSDMGLKATDKELAKFAQQHDVNPRDTGRDYDFGRPVREVFGALQTLSGTNFDDERVYHIFDGGTDRHRYLKQRLYHDRAVAWEAWWKQTGAALVADPAYKEVGLPPAPVAPPVPVPSETVRRKAVLQESNAVLSPPNGTLPYCWEFVDLDTGRATVLPKRFQGRAESPEVREWAIAEGYDLMGGTLPTKGAASPVHVIRPLKLTECRELPDGWWKQEKQSTTLKELRDLSKPAGEVLPRPDRVAGPIDPKGTATYLFQTVEGTVGLLYVGVDVQDDTLKEGGIAEGDHELDPVAFFKGRRFAPAWLLDETERDRSAP